MLRHDRSGERHMPTIDPYMAEILRLNAAQGWAPFETMTAVEARAAAEERNRVWNEDNPAVGRVEDVDMPGPGGSLRLRVYEPKGAAGTGPGVLYIHGGGWVICSLDTHDGICRRLANGSGLRIASLDYRMAPEHPFPAPLDDCLAALAWLRLYGTSVGIDASRLALAGDSAGANLALATCVALKQRGDEQPRTAALIYGAFSADLDSPSHRAFGGGDYVLSTPTIRWFWDQYVPDEAQRADPLVSPLNADLDGMPPLYVSAAELDPLRDDSERIAGRLALAGVDFDYRLWRGVTHACFMMSRLLPAADAHLAEVADFLRRRLAI
jgi:acetyl esterase